MPTIAKPLQPPSVEEADAKISKIDARLRQMEELVQQRADWATYKDSLLRVTRLIAPARLFPTPSNPGTIDPGAATLSSTTVEYAEQVLHTNGPELHIDKVVEFARNSGWEASGDTKKDRMCFYSAMHRQRRVFEKIGRGVWRLRAAELPRR